VIEYTTPALIVEALGPSAAPALDDPYLVNVAAAANAWTSRKRREAGYVDEAVPPDPPVPVGADVTFGATLYGVALWRERASTDSFPSFEEMASFAPTAGTLGQIKRLLGIGRAAVDAPRAPGAVGAAWWPFQPRRGIVRR
jgi:hypothetical protein